MADARGAGGGIHAIAQQLRPHTPLTTNKVTASPLFQREKQKRTEGTISDPLA